MYDVTIAPFEGVHLAAIDHRGDYQSIGHAFERLLTWAAPRGLLGANVRTIGIYYDDPASVPKKDLRAKAGLVVASVDISASSADATTGARRRFA